MTVALLTALALPASLAPMPVAAADTLPGTTSVSKSRYMEICRETGGNPIEQSDGSVTCFYPDGSWSQCWFDTGICQDSPAIKPLPGIVVAPPAQTVADADPAPRPTTTQATAIQAGPDDRAGKHKAKGDKGKKGKGKRTRRQR